MITCDCGSDNISFEGILDVEDQFLSVEILCNSCGLLGACSFKTTDAFDVNWDPGEHDDDEDDEHDDDLSERDGEEE